MNYWKTVAIASMALSIGLILGSFSNQNANASKKGSNVTGPISMMAERPKFQMLRVVKAEWTQNGLE